MPPTHFSRPEPQPVSDDPRDRPPPPVYGEEIDPDMVYARWTTVEWPPFIRPDKHDLYCNKPIRAAEGDRAKLHELPGEQSVRAEPKVHQLSYVADTWVPAVAQYWPTDFSRKKMELIPLDQHVWIDVFIIETKDTDQLSDFLKQLKERVEAELEKDDVKEKIEKAILDGIDSLAGGVTFLGFGVGKPAAAVSKMAASALMELIAWLLDHIFATEAFQEVIVAHKTTGTAEGLRSWVTWGTRDRDTGFATPIDPRADVPDVSISPTTPNPPPPLSTVTLGSYTAARVAYALELPGITWTSESKLPHFLPSDVNKLFLLPNAAHGAIYWPPAWDYGGHVFVPVRARHSDAVYCLALRTEVRAILIDPN